MRHVHKQYHKGQFIYIGSKSLMINAKWANIRLYHDNKRFHLMNWRSVLY